MPHLLQQVTEWRPYHWALNGTLFSKREMCRPPFVVPGQRQKKKRHGAIRRGGEVRRSVVSDYKAMSQLKN